MKAGREIRAERAEILLAMGLNHLDLKESREAAKAFERYLDDFPGGVQEPEATLGLARAWLLENDAARARRILQTLTSRHTSGPVYDAASRLLAEIGNKP